MCARLLYFPQGRFQGAFNKAYSRSDYYQAQFEFSVGNRLKAVCIVGRIALVDIRYSMFFLALLLPRKLFNQLFKWKYGRASG